MKNTRQLILDKALKIAMDSGLQSVTQTGVAEAAGIRQSLLTYYFPRKSDLLAALLENSHRGAQTPKTRTNSEIEPSGSPGDGLAFVEGLFLDRKRMTFFLGFVGQAMDDAELKTILARHVSIFEAELAKHFGRLPGDASIEGFLDHLRGACMRALLEKKSASKIKVDIEGIAHFHGLM
jgi:AcrR family transcriptional regulator